jgi:hypothetical protein
MRRTLIVAAATLAALAAWRCGSDKKKDDGSDNTVTIPSDWDGLSDWDGSALEVVDE